MSMVIVRIAAPVAGALGLLCGCLQEGTALLDASSHRLSSLQTNSLYTENRRGEEQGELLQVRIDGGFTAHDRAKILRAVNEWNHVLNGHARFEIVETDASYRILALGVGAPNPPPGMRSRYLLANVVGRPDGSMTALVFIDRLGNRDLTALMLHEFGHMLGLPHAAEGVMSPEYDLLQWRCVDKEAAAALAARRGLPVDQLNWCDA